MGFFDVAGGPLISAAGGIVSGLVNTFTGQKQSKDLMRYQYELQQKGIEAQNAYNSPQAQMERLQKAGLSPNLVYGSGVDGNQSAAASPSIVNKRGEFDNPLQDAVQQYNLERQLQLEKVKVYNMEQESQAKRKKLLADTLHTMMDTKYLKKTFGTRVKLMSQQLLNAIEQQFNTESNTILNWSRTRNEDARMYLIWEEINNLRARTNLTKEQAITEVVRRESLRAGIRLTEAQIQQVAHYIDYLDSGTDLRDLQYDIQSTDFEAHNELDKWLEEHPNWEMADQILEKIVDRISPIMGSRRVRRGGKAKPTRSRKRK